MHKVAKAFSSSPKKAATVIDTPPVEAPTEIPDPDVTRLNAAAEQARRRKSGRAGTIVSDEDYLG